MAYNETLEKRLDAAWKVFPDSVLASLEKKKMFGGLAYLYKGKMTVGIVKEDLMVRVIDAKMPTVLAQDAVRPMDFTKKPMKEFIYVSEGGIKTEADLQNWLELGLEHAKTKVS